jgi:NADPH-dependent 2,4-dienoyl-CoA reductase/sulfur reductase-like enzyme
MAAHPECARVIEERLVQKGMELRFGAGMAKVEETACGVRTYFNGGVPSEEADLLVVCIGTKANIGFIDPKQVALDMGILVDEHMRTNKPGLYAAGDVAQGKNLLSGERQMLGLWANARCQGRTAGRNMAGGNESFPGNIVHNITHFMGMDFVGIGDVKGQDRIEKRYDGKRYLQLFWNGGHLIGANFLDSYTESGVLKNAIIKGLKQNQPHSSDPVPVIQNRLIKNILMEVEKR